MAERILLVEDDLYLREGLCEMLEREGYDVFAAATILEADARMQSDVPAMVMLDVGLPDGNGIELCKAWRRAGCRAPILFLTAHDEEVQIVRGLDAGGNDYVTKPFRVQELLSRVRALLRRHEPTSFASGGLTVDIEHMSVHRDGELLFVTPTEFKILVMLLRNRGKILTRRQLLEMIWDAGEQFIDDNTLSVHVRRLREKIGAQCIRTIRGVGYKWEDAQ